MGPVKPDFGNRMEEESKQTGIVLTLTHSELALRLLQKLVGLSDWDTVVTVGRTPSGYTVMEIRTRSIAHLMTTLTQLLHALRMLSETYPE